MSKYSISEVPDIVLTIYEKVSLLKLCEEKKKRGRGALMDCSGLIKRI